MTDIMDRRTQIVALVLTAFLGVWMLFSAYYMTAQATKIHKQEIEINQLKIKLKNTDCIDRQELLERINRIGNQVKVIDSLANRLK